jgi:hypothetical protein
MRFITTCSSWDRSPSIAEASRSRSSPSGALFETEDWRSGRISVRVPGDVPDPLPSLFALELSDVDEVRFQDLRRPGNQMPEELLSGGGGDPARDAEDAFFQLPALGHILSAGDDARRTPLGVENPIEVPGQRSPPSGGVDIPSRE